MLFTGEIILSEILRSCIRVISRDTYSLLSFKNRHALLLSRLLGAKPSIFALIRSSAETILNFLNEIGTDKSFCATFSVTPGELENTPESTATTAYGAYLIDVGLRG